MGCSRIGVGDYFKSALMSRTPPGVFEHPPSVTDLRRYIHRISINKPISLRLRSLTVMVRTMISPWTMLSPGRTPARHHTHHFPIPLHIILRTRECALSHRRLRSVLPRTHPSSYHLQRTAAFAVRARPARWPSTLANCPSDDDSNELPAERPGMPMPSATRNIRRGEALARSTLVSARASRREAAKRAAT